MTEFEGLVLCSTLFWYHGLKTVFFLSHQFMHILSQPLLLNLLVCNWSHSLHNALHMLCFNS